MTQWFDEYWNKENVRFDDGYHKHKETYDLGATSRQAEIDELQKRVDVCEKLRDSQFDKLWNLTQAIETARVDADEDFDLFLNYLSNILKGAVE